MSDTERLFVQLEARIADFEKRMGQAERRGTRTYNRLQRGSTTATRRMERDMTRASTRINAALASTATAANTVRRSLMMVGAPIAGGMGLAAITGGARRAVSDLSDLAKTARDVSLDVEDLQGLMRGFERETRITGDQAAQAFERFSRRVGEAANGTGEMNRIVERYGIRLRRANGDLRDQGELLREVANAIRDAATDQERAAIAQAAFGDVGRQMAAAMREGSGALDRMIREAMEAGDVIDRDLIDRAEELDDRFDELTRRAGTFFRTIVVRAADAAAKLGELEVSFDALMRASEGDVRARLGEDADALDADEFDAVADAVGRYDRAVSDLSQTAAGTIQHLDAFARNLRDMGAVEAADGLEGISDRITALIEEFESGQIEVEEFTRGVQGANSDAIVLLSNLGDIDAAGMDHITGQVGTLQDALSAAAEAARDMARAVSAALHTEPSEAAQRRAGENRAQTDALDRRRARAELEAFLATEERRAARTREQIDLERELAAVQSRAREEGIELTEAQAEAQARANLALREAAGGGERGESGGGGGGPGDFTRMVESIRERTEAMQEEAAAITLAAESGMEYGRALQYAQARARLLNAAQSEGLAITPELEAAVHELADAYARAGESAQDAAGKMREAQEDARRGAQAMSDLFMGIMDGSDGAKRALAQLLQRIAEVMMQKALLELGGGGGGGFLGFLGSLLSFDGGGYTGNASRSGGLDGKGGFLAMMHPRETVTDHTNGQQSGGTVEVRVFMDEGGNWQAAVERISGAVSARTVRQGIGEYDRRMPERMQQIQRDPRRRG